MIAQHAGMDDKLDVIFFIRPHDVITRFFDSLGKKITKQIDQFLLTAMAEQFHVFYGSMKNTKSQLKETNVKLIVEYNF